MSRKYFATTVICFIALAFYEVEVSAKTEKDLWRYLFEGQDYDKLFRPVKNPETAVPVSVGLAPVSVKEAGLYIYKVDCWLVVKWKDENLTWDPKKFENITQLVLPISKVWRPDLSLYPGNFEYSFLANATNNVAISFDGEIMWMTPTSIFRRWDPVREGRKCVISIISWTYNNSQMNIDINSKVKETVPDVSVQTSKELKYFSWSVQPYPMIHFTLMKR